MKNEGAFTIIFYLYGRFTMYIIEHSIDRVPSRAHVRIVRVIGVDFGSQVSLQCLVCGGLQFGHTSSCVYSGTLVHGAFVVV